MGPIDPGAQVDHKCRVKSCVNPGHLRLLGRAANWRAAWAFKHGRQMSQRNLRMASWLHRQVGQ